MIEAGMFRVITTVAATAATTKSVTTTITTIINWGRAMKRAKVLLLVSLVTAATFAAFAPAAVQAYPHRACYWDHHHGHRVCHRVR
jgi:hypothetical protein